FEFYPKINHLLRVLATFPVSTTEVELSFSVLKSMKHYSEIKLKMII
ncbi:Dimer Tnp hAT domain-containing protein, partial [Aphis craccivora]